MLLPNDSQHLLRPVTEKLLIVRNQLKTPWCNTPAGMSAGLRGGLSARVSRQKRYQRQSRPLQAVAQTPRRDEENPLPTNHRIDRSNSFHEKADSCQ